MSTIGTNRDVVAVAACRLLGDERTSIRYRLRSEFDPEGDIRGGRETIALLRLPSLTISLVDADPALLSDRLAAFAALERYHHEEDVVGSRCRRDFGRFSSLARLC